MKRRNQNPLVSIITVVYNGEQYLEQTIKSVIDQTYKNIEYIIIDGGSYDGTVEIIKKYQSHITYWLSENDKGVYDAMNKGISLAKGDIIGIINSDDFYSVKAVEIAVYYLNSHEKYEVFFGNLNRIYSPMKEKIIKISIPNSIPKNKLHIVHPTVFVKKEVYDRKIFDDTLKIAADMDFLLSVCNTFNVVKSDEIISNMRIGGLSSNFFMSVTETYIVYRRMYSRLIALQLIFRILLKKVPLELFRHIGLRS
mgnify:CR=1 FL=1